jgi:hypothetical protein
METSERPTLSSSKEQEFKAICIPLIKRFLMANDTVKSKDFKKSINAIVDAVGGALNYNNIDRLRNDFVVGRPMTSHKKAALDRFIEDGGITRYLADIVKYLYVASNADRFASDWKRLQSAATVVFLKIHLEEMERRVVLNQYRNYDEVTDFDLVNDTAHLCFRTDEFDLSKSSDFNERALNVYLSIYEIDVSRRNEAYQKVFEQIPKELLPEEVILAIEKDVAIEKTEKSSIAAETLTANKAKDQTRTLRPRRISN